MQAKEITAAQGSTTIADVARRLGLLKGKLSGHMAGMIRTAAPRLDGIVKANRSQSAAGLLD